MPQKILIQQFYFVHVLYLEESITFVTYAGYHIALGLNFQAYTGSPTLKCELLPIGHVQLFGFPVLVSLFSTGLVLLS